MCMHCQAPSVAVRVPNIRSALSEKGNKVPRSLGMDYECIGKASEWIGKASQGSERKQGGEERKEGIKESRKKEANKSTEMKKWRKGWKWLINALRCIFSNAFPGIWPNAFPGLFENVYTGIINTLTIHFYRGIDNAFLVHFESITMHFEALEIVPWEALICCLVYFPASWRFPPCGTTIWSAFWPVRK